MPFQGTLCFDSACCALVTFEYHPLVDKLDMRLCHIISSAGERTLVTFEYRPLVDKLDMRLCHIFSSAGERTLVTGK